VNKSNRKDKNNPKSFEHVAQKSSCRNAQNTPDILMQNVKFFARSNIYKVMTNILIEKQGQTDYS